MLQVFDKAQTALHKFEVDKTSLAEQDCGNVIRWVLPEDKVEFRFKGFGSKNKSWQSLQHCLQSGQLSFLAER